MLYALGLLISVVGSALVFVPIFADAWGLVKIVVALIGAMILWASIFPARFTRTPIDRPILALILSFIVSLVFSIDPRTGLTGVYSQAFHGAAQLIPAIAIFYAGVARGGSWPRGPAVCAALVALGSGVACALSLLEIADPQLQEMLFQSGRAGGTMGSPVFMGALVATCLPATLWLAQRRGAQGWIGIAGSIGGFLALTAARSRGPWLAVGAGVLAMMAASGRIEPRRALAAAGPLILAIFLAASGLMGKGRSDSGRFVTWKLAARAGIDRPIAGWGPDTFPLIAKRLRTPETMRASPELQASAHNDLLQAWATLGLLGLASWLYLWAAAFRVLWRAEVLESAEGERAAVLGSLVALFVCAKFNPVPPSAYYVAAALGSSVLFDPFAIPKLRPIRFALGLGAVIGGLILASLWVTADAMISFGAMATRSGELKEGANLVRQGQEIAPSEPYFSARRCELIFALIQNRASLKEAKGFSVRALRVASGLVNSRQEDPGSYELMATSELVAAAVHGPGLARSAIKSARRALELDPFSIFAAVRWEQAARKIHDEKEIALARAKIEEIKAVRP